MKINRIRLKEYGLFAQAEDPIEFGNGLTVIYGKNEAGKSTLRHALGEMLFGFRQRRISKHPYGTGQNMTIIGEYTTDEGIHETVQRDLSSKASSKLIAAEVVNEGHNEALKQVSSMPYELYKGLFEMDLTDLSRLDHKKWNAVEEQISIQFGLDNIKSPRRVLQELEEEMYGIWRPHNRGKYIIKEIDEKLFVLKQELRALKQNEDNFREKSVTHRKALERVEQISTDIATLEKWVTQARIQLEPHRYLMEVEEINQELEPYIESLPALESYLSLQSEAERLKEDKMQFETEIKETQMALQPLTGVELKLKESDLSPEEISEKISTLKMLKERLETDKVAVDGFQRLLESKSVELTKDPWNDALANYWQQLDTEGMHRYIQRKKAFKSLSVLVLVLGLGLGGSGYFFNHSLWVIIGAFTALLGLVGQLNGTTRKPCDFGEIRFRKRIWTKTDVFLKACTTLGDEAGQLLKLQNKLQVTRSSYLKEKKDMESLFSKLGLVEDLPSDTLQASLSQVQEQLDHISEYTKQRERVQVKLDTLKGQKRKVGLKLMMHQQKLTALKSKFSLLDDHDSKSIDSALEQFEKLKAKVHRKESVQKVLEEFDEAHPDQQDYKVGVAFAEQFEKALADIESMKEEREALRIQITELGNTTALEKHNAHRRAIESKLMQHETQRQEAVRKYNQSKMLHTVIAYADRVFREKYQPQILRTASAYISKFTAGRYTQLVFNESKQLSVKSSASGEFIQVHETLSRGTLEQIYLALRLAVAEGIDKTKGQLPFVFDEIFVNWDEERMNSAIETLSHIAKKRQVFYMTCHGWMRDLLVEHGASAVNLGE